jgi:oligoendopeptidase F
MLTGLPSSPDAFRDGDWGRIAPLYEELAARPLDDVGTWLRDWSELEGLVDEASELAGIAYTTDTNDAEKERLHLVWSGELAPRLHEQRVRLARRLVESGYEEPGMEVPIRRLRNQIALYREENLPLQGDLARLRSRYAKVTGQMQVEWDGERLTVPQVQAKLGEADRDVRERAYRLHLRPYVEARDELGTIFDEMVELRQRVAHNAGFANYRDFAHQEKDRFDYTPDDCLRWHDAVEEVAVPAATRALERRRLGMGLDRLRPWDVEGSPDPLGRPALRPFRDARELVETAGGVFEQVDPALGERFRTMAGEGLLDLDSRLGKAAGGYCVALSHRRRPFIFMNATGTQKDVDTLLHESGHSFHVFECAAAQPLHWQQQYGAEIAEVASMSMELLCAPHLAASEGGFYASEEDATRARAENLERILLFFGHCASVDAFQHWIYTDPGGTDRAARDRRWLELRARFEPGIDHSGLETERVARWHRQLHFFEVPFYYIEYGLAQLGALQVWRESRRDRPAALAAYRRALALGGTRPLPELYAAAGARLLFDREGIRELIELVESELDTLAG